MAVAMTDRGPRPARDVFWASLRWPGLEHLHVEERPDGVVAVGAITGRQEETDYRLGYRIECDVRWRTRAATVDLTARGVRRSLALHADGEGAWTDGEGHPLTSVAGALDVDIAATPFTNTLPIRRLGLAPGEQADVRAAWVRIPSLDVQPLDQRYRCLARDDHRQHWRYGSPAHGFSADLETDTDGLVVDYPPFFERAWPQPEARAGLLVVVATMIEHEGSLLLLRRSPTNDHAPGEWETGSGRLEAGESPLAAVVRETKEETGLDVEVVGPLDTFRYLRGADRVPSVGLAFHCRVRGGGLRLSDEHDAARWVPLDQAREERLPDVFRRALEVLRRLSPA
jgi:8-oxo-dGTP pyrophosphatase MutT (NUDIX family)